MVGAAQVSQRNTALVAQSRIGVLRVRLEVVRLGPDDGVIIIGINEHDRVRQAVSHMLEGDGFGRAGKHHVLPNRDQTSGLARLDQSFDLRALINSRHFGNELFVVLAIPWLIKMELLVQLHLIEERQQVHAPTQERLVGFVKIGHGGKVPVGIMVLCMARPICLKLFVKFLSSRVSSILATMGLSVAAKSFSSNVTTRRSSCTFGVSCSTSLSNPGRKSRAFWLCGPSSPCKNKNLAVRSRSFWAEAAS